MTEDSVVQFPAGGKRIQIDRDAHLASCLVGAGGYFFLAKTSGTYRLFLHYTTFLDDMMINKHKDVFTFTSLEHFSDVLGSAKGWAASLMFHPSLRYQFQTFLERTDTFSLGICNGCQLMSLLGWVGLKSAGKYPNIVDVFMP